MDVQSSFVYFVLLIYGLVSGSLINALVWRLKNKMNWLSGRSQCSLCEHRLSPIDLIPVFSWILLRGRCRYCKKRIKDNPLVELLTGISFTFSYIFWPYDFDIIGIVRFIIWLFALVILISIFIYDFKWMIIPNKLIKFFLVLGLIQLIIYIAYNFSVKNILLILSSVLIGGGVFHIIYILSKGKMIGGGDIKLGYAYGLFLLNPALTWLVLVFASFIGTFASICLILLNKTSFKSKIPFGPFLILGIILSHFFGINFLHFLNAYVYY